MNVEIICSIIAAIGLFASAISSWLIARYSTEKELKKLRESWKREDILSSSEEFATMCGEVARYARSQHSSELVNAAQRVAYIRAKESGELALSLDELYNAVTHKIPNLVDASLSRVIKEYRESRGQ